LANTADNEGMKMPLRLMIAVVLGSAMTLSVLGQTARDEQSVKSERKAEKTHKGRSAGGDVASGTGNIAGGAAKASGHAAEGVGKGAADLATLHPIDAATDVAKGGVAGGKDAAVGTTKGTAKVVKGIGKGLKHIL
jgi:hypothetical protein